MNTTIGELQVTKESVPFGIQSITHRIICTYCFQDIPSSRAANSHYSQTHQKQFHPNVSIDRSDVSTKWNSTFSNANNLTSIPKKTIYENAPFTNSKENLGDAGILSPLAGMKTFHGYKCIHCAYCARNERTMQKHLEEEHEIEKSKISQVWRQIEGNGTVFLQSLKGGNNSRPFQVSHEYIPNSDTYLQSITLSTTHPTNISCSTPLPNINTTIPNTNQSTPDTNTSSIQQVKSYLSSLMTPTYTNTLETNRNDINAFIAINQWDIILQEYNIPLQQACEFNGKNTTKDYIEKQIIIDMKNYLSDIDILVRNLHPSTLSKINLRSNDNFYTVTKNTSDRYAHHASKLIISAYQFYKKNKSLLPTTHHSSLQDYIEAIQSNNSNLRQTHFHSLLKGILLISSNSISIKYLFIRLFFAVSMVSQETESNKITYRYVKGYEVSHLMSSLQYTCSTCCIREITSCFDEPCQYTSQYLSISNEDEIIKMMDLESTSVSSYIRHCLKTTMSSVIQQDGNVEFQDCTTHAAEICGIVKNVHFSLKQQGLIVKELHQKIEKLMKNRLLFNSNFPTGFQSKIANLQDKLRCSATGYSFLSDAKNQHFIENNMNWLLETFKQNPNAHVYLTCPEQSTAPPPSSSSNPAIKVANTYMYTYGVQQWLHSCQEIQNALLVCLHLSSGLPPRATEIATFNIQNTPSQTRNVYVSQADLFILAKYNKTRNLKKIDVPVLRFPDKTTSNLLITYLTLFRPLEAIMVGLLENEEKKSNHWNNLFVNRGIKKSDNDISKLITNTLHSFGIPLQFQDLRHHSTGMTRTVASIAAFETTLGIELSLYNTGHSQAGHSVATAEKKYAYRYSDIREFSYEKINQLREWCHFWHLSLGLKPCDVSSFRLNINQLNQKSIQPSIVTNSDSNGSTLQQINSTVIAEYSTQISKHILSLLHKQLSSNSSFKRTRSDFPDSRQIHISTDLPSIKHTNISFYRSALHSMNNSNCDFRNQLQLSITAAIHENKQNLFIIMPTGSGKTFSLFIPIYLEKLSKCTILVIPLISLIKDIKERANHYNIAVGGWEDRHQLNSIQLFVISVEHLYHSDMKIIIQQLQSQKRLARIVFDEAHVFLLWKDFRSSLRNLQFALSSLNINEPKILLTATCPPDQRKLLLSRFGINHVVLYHSTTVRKNISYKVVNIDQNQYQPKTKKFTKSDILIIQNISIFVKEQVDHMISSKSKGRIIIFSMTRQMCHDIACVLKQEIPSLTILVYQSGLSNEEKESIQNTWMSPLSNSNSIRIICCTSSFGTGLDTPNVRAVFHAGGSYSIMDYIQESGRAGRDDLPSKCIIVHSPSFISRFKRSFMEMNTDSTLTQQEYNEKKERLEEIIHYMNLNHCRKNYLFNYIDGIQPGFCDLDCTSENCDYCISLKSNSISTTISPTTSNQTQTTHLQNSILQHSQSPKSILNNQKPSISKPIHIDEEIVSKHELDLYDEIYDSFLKHQNPSPKEKSILQKFNSFATQLEPFCIPCLILHNQEQTHSSCNYKSERCLRCFAIDHRLVICSFKEYVKDHCSKCFLLSCQNNLIHTSGFGTSCIYESCRDLCWMLWNSNNTMNWRSKIANMFFSENQLLTFKTLVKNQNENDLRSLFNNWIRSSSNNNIPNIIKLCLYWNDEIGFKLYSSQNSYPS